LLLLAGVADPERLAVQVLRAVTPSTAVSSGPPAVVAGRGVHILVLRPRTRHSLIGRVEVSLDAARHLPLGVSVYSRGADSPSLTVAFESVSFEAIPDEIFDFRPPAGSRATSGAGGGEPGGQDGLLQGWRLLGSGWSSAAALRLEGEASPIPPELLPFDGNLITAEIVTVGRARWLVTGPVPLGRLQVLSRELE
jgi:hypothetical protein